MTQLEQWAQRVLRCRDARLDWQVSADSDAPVTPPVEELFRSAQAAFGAALPEDATPADFIGHAAFDLAGPAEESDWALVTVLPLPKGRANEHALAEVTDRLLRCLLRGVLCGVLLREPPTRLYLAQLGPKAEVYLAERAATNSFLTWLQRDDVRRLISFRVHVLHYHLPRKEWAALRLPADGNGHVLFPD